MTDNKYPQEIQETVAEILRIKAENLEMHNPNNQTIEDYEKKQLDNLLSPTYENAGLNKNAIQVKIRKANEKLATVTRMNARLHQMHGGK